MAKPKQLFIAKTANFQGCWGSSLDSPHAAIAMACEHGAKRSSVFIVYDAYEGCSVGEMGGLRYLMDHGEPPVDGCYDAAGNLLGSDLADAAAQARCYGEWEPTESALNATSWADLLKHKA